MNFRATFYFSIFILISPAHSYTSSDTLPKGVRAAAAVYGFGRGIESNFNSNGKLEDIASPINRSVSIDDFAAAEPALKNLQKVVNDIEPGLGDQLLHANLYGDVKVDESRYYVGFLYGLNDQLSVGANIPVISRTVSPDIRAEVVNNAAALQNEFGNVPKLKGPLEQLAKTNIDTETFEEAIFVSNGYKRPLSTKSQGLGDLELETRYSYLKTKWVNLAVRGKVQAPTGTHNPDMHNLFDRELSEKNWATRVGSIHEFTLLPKTVTVSTAVWGIYRAPRKVTMAFPETSADPLPNLNDPNQIENVTRKNGNGAEASLGLNVSTFWEVVNWMATYEYYYKQGDKIQGNRGLDYERWINTQATEIHSIELGIELSTIPLYLRKVFPAPGKLAFSWNQPISGRNATYAPFGRIDFILLF